MGDVFKGKGCAGGAGRGAWAGRCTQLCPGQGNSPHCLSWRKAVSPLPGSNGENGEKLFHHGQEGRTCTEHGAVQWEGQQLPFATGAPWMELDKTDSHTLANYQLRAALPPHAAASPVPTPPAERCQPFSAPQKPLLNARGSFFGVSSTSAEG